MRARANPDCRSSVWSSRARQADGARALSLADRQGIRRKVFNTVITTSVRPKEARLQSRFSPRADSSGAADITACARRSWTVPKRGLPETVPDAARRAYVDAFTIPRCTHRRMTRSTSSSPIQISPGSHGRPLELWPRSPRRSSSSAVIVRQRGPRFQIVAATALPAAVQVGLRGSHRDPRGGRQRDHRESHLSKYPRKDLTPFESPKRCNPGGAVRLPARGYFAPAVGIRLALRSRFAQQYPDEVKNLVGWPNSR